MAGGRWGKDYDSVGGFEFAAESGGVEEEEEQVVVGGGIDWGGFFLPLMIAGSLGGA